MSESATGTRFDWLVAHGWNATSFQTLEPGLSYFPDDRGYVAYFDTGGAWVAAGAPVAATGDIPAVVAGFLEAAAGAGRRVRFFGVEERFLGLCPELRAARIGLQPSWDPTRWVDGLAGARGLREQLRRARAKGATADALGTAVQLALFDAHRLRGPLDGCVAAVALAAPAFAALVLRSSIAERGPVV